MMKLCVVWKETPYFHDNESELLFKATEMALCSSNYSQLKYTQKWNNTTACENLQIIIDNLIA